MNKSSSHFRGLLLALLLSLLSGCGGSSATTAPLNAQNLNLIFVSSPDLAYQAPGDIRADTANLSPQGLQRSLLMASYLKQQLMGGNNVNAIYALTPMTHLQTSQQYPDMAGSLMRNTASTPALRRPMKHSPTLPDSLTNTWGLDCQAGWH